jgi:hypothetical protein
MDSERFQRYKLNEDIEIFSDEISTAYYFKENEIELLNLYYFDCDDDYKIFHNHEIFVVFINNKEYYYPGNYAIKRENDHLYPFIGEDYGHMAFKIKNNKVKIYGYCKLIDIDEPVWIDINKIGLA